MDLSIIKNNLAKLKNIKHLFKYIKEVFKLPFAKTYFFVSIVLVILFIIITFPYDAIILNGMKSLEKSAVKTITIDGINFGFFGSSNFTGIHIVLPADEEIKIDELILDPLKPISIYMSKKIKTDLKINKLKLNFKQANLSLDLVSNIDLELNKKSLQAENGSLNFMISKLKVKLGKLDLGPELSMLKLPENFSFRSINLRSQLANKNLQINNLKIIGSEISGNITGSISLRSLFKNSRLQLTIKIDSTSKLLSEYKAILEGMKYIHPDGNLLINITGSVSRPKIRIKKTDSSDNGGGDDNNKHNRKLNTMKSMEKMRHMLPGRRTKKGFEEYRDPRNKNKDD